MPYTTARPTRRTAARLLALLFATSLAACSDQTAPIVRAPQVRSVAVDTTHVGAILLHITLDSPGAISIEYWTDPAHKLLLTANEGDDIATLALPRLEWGATYHYVVNGVGGAESAPVEGTLSTLPLPDDLAALSLTSSGTPSAPITMLEVTAQFHGFVAIDRTGRIVWWFRTAGIPQGFTRRANGNFVLDDAGTRLVEVTASGDVVHELSTSSDGAHPSHHDVVATPQNTLLFIAQEKRAVGDSTLTGDAIWEWSPEANTLVKRWNTFDFYDPSADIGNRSTSSDWVHTNSLALGDHGNVILSMNWLDQVISIAPDWQSIEWKLGGRGSTYSLGAGAMFNGQHTAQLLANGHVLMFDNGRDRAAPNGYSRGLELALDDASHTASEVWEFRTTPDSYKPYVGSARRLSNGNTVVNFGLASGFVGATGPLSVYEVTPSGSVVWQLVVNNASVVYRATPLTSIANEVDVP